MLGADFLDGITHMHHDIVTDGEWFMLQHEQVDVTLHALCLAARHKTIYFNQLHRYTQTHADHTPQALLLIEYIGFGFTAKRDPWTN